MRRNAGAGLNANSTEQVLYDGISVISAATGEVNINMQPTERQQELNNGVRAQSTMLRQQREAFLEKFQ
jgi:hypothetical protein